MIPTDFCLLGPNDMFKLGPFQFVCVGVCRCVLCVSHFIQVLWLYQDTPFAFHRCHVTNGCSTAAVIILTHAEIQSQHHEFVLEQSAQIRWSLTPGVTARSRSDQITSGAETRRAMSQNQEVEKDWSSLEPDEGTKIFLTVLFSLILVLGIVGNSLTIHVSQLLQRKGYLPKGVTDHMVSLACSDLLVLLIGMPVELYYAIWFPFSSTGNAACKIYNFLFEACSYATILNVATLSFERYQATCQPFQYRAQSGSCTAKLLVLAWFCSVLVAVPLLVATGSEGHVPEGQSAPTQNLTFCTNLSEHWVMYRASIFTAFVLYLLVLGGVAFMCRSMILVLKAPVVSEDSGGNSAGRDGSKHESSQQKTARRQSIMFLVLIVCTLLVCWMPNQARRLMTASVPKSSWTFSYLTSYVTLQPVADTFFYLSSVLNPLLYTLSSRQFRSATLQTLCCRQTLQHANRRALDLSLATRSTRPLLRRSRSAAAAAASSSTGPADKPGLQIKSVSEAVEA